MILKKYDSIIIFFLFSISLSLRVYNYTKLSVIPDEIEYSDYAFSIIANHWAWPPEEMVAQPPLFPYLLAILTYLFNGSLEVLKTVPIFFGSMDVVMIYFLGKILYDWRVGLLSAILLCFSSFHLYFSRTLMLETILIFFILASMYFFWRAYEKNSIYYSVVSGIFIGLANDAKYSALLLYPFYTLFLLWTHKRRFLFGWKSIIEKKFLVIIFVSLIFFSPVLLDLYIYGMNPFYWQLFQRYEVQFVGYKSVGEFGITDLLIRGFNNYVGLLMDKNSVATSSLPWISAFELVASALLIITILYYLYFLFWRISRESFLMIMFLVFNAFVAVFSVRFQYYLLWAIPTFFIMMSNMIINFKDELNLKYLNKKIKFSLVDFVKILTLVFACIFIISYIVIGIYAPFVNESIKVGYEKHILSIKDKIHQGESIATDKIEILYYYLNKPDFNTQENNIHVLPLYKKEKKLDKIYIVVNLDLLNTAKPRYIITSTYTFFAYATIYDKITMKKDYILISNENDVLLYERKLSLR